MGYGADCQEQQVRKGGVSRQSPSFQRTHQGRGYLPVPGMAAAGERGESLRSVYLTEVPYSLMNGVFSVTDRPTVFID